MEDFDYQIDETEEDYFNWRQSAQEHGLLHNAALSYYISDAKNLYTILIDGELETAPIFTYRQWLYSMTPVDDAVELVQQESETTYDTESLQELVKTIGMNTGKKSGKASEFIWNGPVFAATDSHSKQSKFTLQPSKYYTVKSTSEKLRNELYQALYDAGVDADASYLDVIEPIGDVQLPYRDSRFGSFNAVQEYNSPRLTGGSAVTVFNTGSDYVIPISKRSQKVSEAPGWKSPVPGGVFQPPTDETPETHTNVETAPLENHLLSEFYLTFLQNIPNDKEAFENLQKLLNNNSSSQLWYTGGGIDCQQAYVQLYNLFFIDDPEFYNTYIKNQDLQNWESDTIEFISLSDADDVKSILDRHTVNPYNLLGFAEALFTLQDELNVDIPVDLSRA